MDKIRISGGVALKGELEVSGAKNAALPILCASLLSASALELDRVPRLQDVRTMAKLLKSLGVGVREDGARSGWSRPAERPLRLL